MSELLGWISSDGGYSKSNVKIYQSISANKEKVERIRFLLNNMKIDYKYNVRNRFFISQKNNKKKESLEAIFSINSCDSRKIKKIMPEKKPTVEFMNERGEIIKCFLNGFIEGDGHIRKDNGRKSIIQKDKDTMDILQMLCFKVGYSTNLKQRKDKKWNLYIRKNKFSGVRNTNGKEKAVKNTKYKGIVWCASTKYTTFVARRNGNVMITGNTFPSKLIYPCVQASTSEEGCCSECGTPWIRTFDKVKEKADNKKGYILELKDNGFKKDCKCHTDKKKRCLVLDPFNGTGTTGEVAISHHQDYVGIDLNPEYLKITRKRLTSSDNCFCKEVFKIEDILND